MLLFFDVAITFPCGSLIYLVCSSFVFDSIMPVGSYVYAVVIPFFVSPARFCPFHTKSVLIPFAVFAALRLSALAS